MASKKAYRDPANGKVSGVLAGLSEYANLDVGLVRLSFIFLVIFTGFFPGILFYIAAIFILEEKPTATKPADKS